MGTNYYIRENICKCCDRFEEEHLGKSSMGRDFGIRHHTDKYNSWNEFKKYLKGKRIFDEYGEEQKLKEFIKFIEQKKKDNPFKHREVFDPHGKYIDGYYFLDVEFF